MKILIANLGSTSVKYRLFDFSSGDGELLVRGGIERVDDHAVAIEQLQCELKEGGWISSEADLTAVGFKTIMAEGMTGCLELTEEVVESMEMCNYVAPAHNPPYISGIRLFAEKMPEI
ncbi:MAG: acetate kinase, partial [Verrucomicrobiales bacterium]|nr:acetate kinase [Verrucomicrobiales bacterium]